MPYRRVRDLPDSVKKSLPAGAKQIFKEAFNHAWKHYASPKKRRGKSSRETTARKVAWQAVKQAYRKKSGTWVKK